MATGMTLVGEEDQLRRTLAGGIQVVVKNGTEVAVTCEIAVLMTEIYPPEEDHHSDLTAKNVCLLYRSKGSHLLQVLHVTLAVLGRGKIGVRFIFSHLNSLYIKR